MTSFGKMFILAAIALAMLAATASAESGLATKRQEKRLLDCTLEAKTIDDCNPIGYAIRLAVFSAPGLIIAVFYILCCPLYCCAKYCCNCCGGRSQSPNFCFPHKELPARYSTGDIIRPKVFALLCLLTAIAALIWGMTGVGKLSAGMSDSGSKIIEVPDLLQDLIDEIDTALTVDRYSSDTDSYTQEKLLNSSGSNLKAEAEKNKEELKKTVDDNMGNYQDQIKQLENALFAIFALPAVLIVLGGLAAVCNIHNVLPMAVVWFLFLIGLILWIAHAVFCLTSMLLGDLCAEIHGLANKQMNVIAPLLQCEDKQFADFRNEFKALEVDQSEQTCEGLLQVCYNDLQSATQNLADGRVYTCPPALNCSGKDFADILTLMETAFYTDTRIVNLPTVPTTVSIGAACAQASTAVPEERCYISTCSDECRDGGNMNNNVSDYGKKARELYYNFLSARTVSNALDTLGAKFSTCDAVFGLIISPFSPPCDDLTSGTVYGRQASGLLGLCTLAGIFIFAWGAKRFISTDEAEKPQGGDQVEDVKKEELDG